MEIKFEQAVVALLAVQVFLTLILVGGFNDFTEELFDENKDSSKSCDCYCDYPYYWYYDTAVAEDADPERDAASDNSTDEA